MKISLLNPAIRTLPDDVLYHLGLNTHMDLATLFGDTRFVCMGGSPVRAKSFALKIAERFKYDLSDTDIKPLGKDERFSLYKVGPIISVSHGMGMPSISILMHEITKLLFYAGCLDPIFLRVGTSGGIGLEPGSVVVSEEALNAELEATYKIVILGKEKQFATPLDLELAKAIIKANPNHKTVLAKTVSTNCFYEEQARLDGTLIPNYTESEKMQFLNEAHKKGVRNFEMEALQFAAFCKRAGIKGAVICATLVDRLRGDQVTSSADELKDFSNRSQEVALNFMDSILQLQNLKS